VTRIYQECAGHIVENPERIGLRNFAWTHEAIEEWEVIWHTLWQLGYKWEWQNYDPYVRRRGDKFERFGVHDDAYRLDMAIPLPGVQIIEEVRQILLDDPGDDPRLDHTIGALGRWLEKHQGHCLPHTPGGYATWKQYNKGDTSCTNE